MYSLSFQNNPTDNFLRWARQELPQDGTSRQEKNEKQAPGWYPAIRSNLETLKLCRPLSWLLRSISEEDKIRESRVFGVAAPLTGLSKSIWCPQLAFVWFLFVISSLSSSSMLLIPTLVPIPVHPFPTLIFFFLFLYFFYGDLQVNLTDQTYKVSLSSTSRMLKPLRNNRPISITPWYQHSTEAAVQP